MTETVREPRYTVYDFTESLRHSDVVGQIVPAEIAIVLAAWGEQDDGWTGGFLMKMRDGRTVYLSGWCDYTGWGCQDGAKVEWRSDDSLPDEKTGYPEHKVEWETDCSDLNAFIARGMPEGERF